MSTGPVPCANPLLRTGCVSRFPQTFNKETEEVAREATPGNLPGSGTCGTGKGRRPVINGAIAWTTAEEPCWEPWERGQNPAAEPLQPGREGATPLLNRHRPRVSSQFCTSAERTQSQRKSPGKRTQMLAGKSKPNTEMARPKGTSQGTMTNLL